VIAEHHFKKKGLHMINKRMAWGLAALLISVFFIRNRCFRAHVLKTRLQ
jgi:hypothetical protein